ncbi:MAG: hypothetical protein R6V05_00640 [Candidatus Brocadiia bacterium]
MRKSPEARVEDLSKRLGGRFKLTTLVEKQAKQYVRGGRAFMPSVRNLHELFEFILDEVDEGRIGLLLPGEEEELDAGAGEDDTS